jgi:signal transduction histidine kinase
MQGDITTEFDRKNNNLQAGRVGEQSLLELYVPVRNSENQVVAVVEFCLDANRIRLELIQTERGAWGVTAAVFAVMITGLWVIFLSAGTVIDSQRRSLISKVTQLSHLLKQNHDLQQRVSRASRQAAEENERFLLSIGADLHDGPAQAIGYALLRLDALAPATRASHESHVASDFESVRRALTDAMTEIRDICSGLSMPEIQRLSLGEALDGVIRRHEQRTHTMVQWKIPNDLPLNTSHFTKLSLCRFVQEGLNNAFRHAEGRMQRVDAWSDGAFYFVEVEDGGFGINATPSASRGLQLGLNGLKNRIESWGGAITVTSPPGLGTRLTAAIPLEAFENGSNT